MKYLYASFTGYAGFYHGMGLDTIEIDFSKCVSNITLITGRNASGKTTLLNALNLFPDSSSSFTPGVDAEKKLRLFDNGNVYDIQIISPADSKGGRKVSKAFIQKNGMELNSNGNISSYKDIIFSEFDLDSNFISLSKLSSLDRGLGDKTPAERKKFVASIVENLETYNDIYKTLNKKSLIFKSHINNLHTKIQNIGAKETIEATLATLRRRESELNDEIFRLNNTIVAIEAKSNIDEEEAQKIQSLTDDKNRLEVDFSTIDNELKVQLHSTKLKEDIVEEQYKKDSDMLQFYKGKVETTETLWKEKSRSLSELQESIINLESDLKIYDNNSSDTIISSYDESNKRLTEIRKELKSLSIPDDPKLKFTIQSILDEYQYFINYIDALRSYATKDMIQFITIDYDPNKIQKLLAESEKQVARLDSIKNQMSDLKEKMSNLATLENRPKSCKNDTCPFIANAINIKKAIGKRDLISEFEALENDMEQTSISISNISTQIDLVNSYVPERSRLDAVMEHVFKITSIGTGFIPDYLNDNNTIMKMINDDNAFNDLRDPERLSQGLVLLSQLESEIEVNIRLESEYKSAMDKVQLLNSSKVLLEKRKAESTNLITEVSKLKSELDNYTELQGEFLLKTTTESGIVFMIENKKKVEEELNKVNERLAEFKSKSDKALSMLSNIQEYKNSIIKYQSELAPLQQEISRLSGQMTLLNSYYNEYNEYNSKYNLIETIKKYCSPTGGGIQTVFMQLYMSKTLDLANQILGMLFKGEYRLLDFIINEDEFRIPFVGDSKIPIDDIAYGSNSQVSMIGMIINLVLLHQASTHYNISRLDEIDGSADGYNRGIFIDVLKKCIEILNIDQVFIISHSVEVDNASADIIKFKGYDEFDENKMLGNVIFDYEEYIKTVK